MSNFKDLPDCKPINRVEENIYELNKLHTQIKIDVAEIKSDLKIILQRIKEKEVKKQEDIAKGWFF